MLEYFHADNYPDTNSSSPVTPFLLIENLDLAALGPFAARAGMHGGHERNELTCLLDAAEVERFRVFADGFAVLEVAMYSGMECMRALTNRFVGTKPIIVRYIIEFPDDELLDLVRATNAAVRHSQCFCSSRCIG